MKLKAILFDFGFTLFYFKNPSVEKYLECFTRGLEKSVNLLSDLKILKTEKMKQKFIKIFNRQRKKQWGESLKSQQEFPTYLLFEDLLNKLAEDRFVEQCKSLGKEIFLKLADLFHSVEMEHWKPFKTTKITLKKLSNRENLKLAVLSNHPHHRFILNILKHNNLSQYFDAIVTSAEFGKRKPNSEIFRYTLKKLALSENSHNCLMCGDEYADIIGGQRAGLQTILCKRKYEFPFEKEIKIKNLREIESISEILDLL